MRYHGMQATETLVNESSDPEVIDVRSLKPFDLYSIGKSVKKTHCVLIVEECMRTGCADTLRRDFGGVNCGTASTYCGCSRATLPIKGSTASQ
ncbi:hypothetical protein OPV22_004328 [Ensete ventricosum]|uniref:pyruvate dehydrogenase (acetyl-transferring) n=1 Tax=Ensete ventricosum TaxID=4639 RepID=A0AAV8S3I1_ENSVE|nr:hypothetical protein OPV22_004328 [Ensete ventricosum]